MPTLYKRIGKHTAFPAGVPISQVRVYQIKNSHSSHYKRYFSINLLLNPPADVAEGVREALFAYLKETGYDSKI